MSVVRATVRWLCASLRLRYRNRGVDQEANVSIDVTRLISGGGHLFFVDTPDMSLIRAWGRLEHRAFRLALVDLFPPQHRQSGKHQDIAEHLWMCHQRTSTFSGEALL